MIKLLYLTNIPAPYRQKRFNKMAELFPAYGIEFEVLYMAKIEPNRDWIIPSDTYKYNYKIYKGFHPTIGKFYAHFNPGIFYRLTRKDYDVIIIGGMANPTLWFSQFFVPSSVKKIMSVETNLLGSTNKGGLTRIIKNKLIANSNAYQVTGQPQKEYINFFSKQSVNKKFVFLPNLIDGEFFIREVDKWRLDENAILKEREKLGVSRGSQLWIVPSRLDRNKLPDNFIESTKTLKDVRIVIIGSGPLRNDLEDRIKENDLPITLIPFVQQQELVKYLAIANIFCLSSYSDASPLSVIEACASGLPIIVSKNIGNLGEVLVEGRNGFSFDPHEILSIKKCFNLITQKSSEELIEMGKVSRENYFRNFDPDQCVHKYAKGILEVVG